VTSSDLLRHLADAFGEKAALRRRHEAVARVAGQYDLNNTYQYVIAREDQHLGWLASAILDLGGGTVSGDATNGGVVMEDAQALDAFVKAWRPRAAGITHARHQRMIEVMLGEMLEQSRLFHQAASGSVDLLGRRTGGDRTPGVVLPTRWVE
jgi:hypothetical protein